MHQSSDSEYIQGPHKIYTKKRILSLIGVFIILYALCIQWQFIVSLGLGQDNIDAMLRGLIPAVGAVVVALALYVQNLSFRTLAAPALVGLSWIITGPYLAYITLINGNTVYLNNIYDIYNGLFLFAVLFLLSMTAKQFLPRVISALVMTGLLLLVVAVNVMQWAYYSLYQSCITTSGSLIIFQTGPAETLEYLHSLGAGMIIGTMFLLFLIIAFFFGTHYMIPSLPKTTVYKKILPLLSLLVIVPSVWILYDELLPNSFPVRTFLDTHDYLERAKLYAENHDDKYAALQAVQLNPRLGPNTVIVVIGESETRTLMNAYTPSAPDNTPWLSAVKEDPHFTLFTNVYSCVWYTVPVLEHALTESNFYNTKQFNESISIIDMAKKAGYKTYWFSNQGSVGVADTPISLIAKTADVSEWVDQDLKESTLDGALLQFLTKVNPNEKNFVVLHIMGSHIEYRNRYPAEFQKFDDGKINQEADYDNTILYTDWFLSQVFDYARDNLHLDAMLYFSDHGSDPSIARQPDGASFKVLRIPMFTWLSDDYMQRNPEITTTLKSHAQSYFTNDLVYELVCGILNMQSPAYDDSISLASPKWHWEKKDLVTRFGKTPLTEDTEY